MNLPELAAHVAAEFQKHYGRAPRWIVAAPGRVNLIGEHTDYNDGFVLPLAIERYAIMAADNSDNLRGKILIYDTQFQERATIDVSAPVTKGLPKWSNYIRGVLAGFQQRGAENSRARCRVSVHRAARRRLEQQRRARSLHRDLDGSRDRQKN
jgi:galactokinase